MDATLENAICYPDPAGQHDINLVDVLEVSKKASVTHSIADVSLVRFYTNPVVSDIDLE